MQIGVQISSFKRYLQTPEGVLSTLKKLRAIGYRVAQIQWIAPDVPDACIRDALAETGMKCAGTQDASELVLQDFNHVVAQNRMWGGDDICVSGLPEEKPTWEGLKAFSARLREAARRAAEEGMTLSFHPLAPAYAEVAGSAALDILLGEAPELNLLIDVFHADKAGQDPTAWIRKYKGRMRMIHFKDRSATDPGLLVPVGQGAIDWPPIIAACREAGAGIGFAEQESWQKDAFACFEDAYRYLTGMGMEP